MKASTRFWSKVKKTPSCWNWTAGTWPDGYGRFYCAGEVISAHRQAYEWQCGPIPDGMQVLHTCDNPPCVRGDHLFLGTNADNVADRVAKGRSSTGEGRPNHKLTEEDVSELRGLYAHGNESMPRLARRFGVVVSQVWRIIHGVEWSPYRERSRG